MATEPATAQDPGNSVTQRRAENAVRTLLLWMGEDPNRDGLIATPERVARAMAELTSGYALDPKEILTRSFEVKYDEMILLRRISFHSLCEHHLLPFHGTASVGYIPQQKVVGISKLARLVEAYAKRLQIQERMTNQIAEAVQTHLNPLGVGVIVKAHHLCMGCRGVKKPQTEMITSAMYGIFRTTEARAEFLKLAEG